jgi:hypothetical protein
MAGVALCEAIFRQIKLWRLSNKREQLSFLNYCRAGGGALRLAAISLPMACSAGAASRARTEG